MQGAGGEATPKILAVVHEYSDLTNALADRIYALNTTQEATAELAGLPSRYLGKVLSARPVRSLGRLSLGPLLASLGVKILLAEDAEAFKRIENRIIPRKKQPAMRGAVVHLRLSCKFLREIGHKGGLNSRRYMSARKASSLGRRAANARWRNGHTSPVVR
jgi:hypothetical protein